MHTWFHLIERAIPGKGKVAVAKKVAADMVIVAPAMALGFFTVTKSMEGERLSDAFEIAKTKLYPTMAMNYKVWPVANLMVFTLIPFQYRTPFVNCVSLGWSTFLSRMASNRIKEDHEMEIAVAVAIELDGTGGFGALVPRGVISCGVVIGLESLRDSISGAKECGRRHDLSQQWSFMQPEVVELAKAPHFVSTYWTP
ncbi:uncharacterized protein PITG_01661 [Phytophthora infestans T30-4]|uniref:Protein Mpv17 n=1 Tax=Phytophthora infestans (strain T30-4) TaxID=403677 RepID=D0MTS1_PHYIT|nr:uncharacterized protein PITG_01661 [Phytophthora infestans T30-4]EEY61368.1 conserved hypothetical protein [Phytophthora infestans T30-4]|eukprot:XP_002908285.1 conserved hypothetical protein [Phytophthora infestans T30-4]